MHLITKGLEFLFHNFVRLFFIPEHHFHQIKFSLHQTSSWQCALDVSWSCSVWCQLCEFHCLLQTIEFLLDFTLWLLWGVHSSALFEWGITCYITGLSSWNRWSQSAKDALVEFWGTGHHALSELLIEYSTFLINLYYWGSCVVLYHSSFSIMVDSISLL